MDIYAILGIIFAVVATTILMGGVKNSKSPSDLTIPEFNRNKSRAIAILCPVIGLLIIGYNLYDWHVSGSADYLIQQSLVFGLGLILYGLYRWWRLSKEK